MKTSLHFKSISLFLVAFLSPALAADAPATAPGKAKLFFWKVTSPTTTVYLLGSIHAGSKDMYPLPPEIEAAYAQAAVLGVELDIDQVDQSKMMTQVMTKGVYPPGDSLDKHLSPEAYKAFQKFCTENGLPPDALNQMKPGVAMMTVLTLALQKMGMSPDDGIDKHFLDQAHAQPTNGPAAPAKRILELETLDDQLKLIFDLDDKLAEASLLDDIRDNTKEELTKLFTAWKAGDAKTVESMLLTADKKNPDSAKLMDTMLYSRNEGMTAKIDELLKGKDKALVIVGAAHLLGDKGILKKLEQKNYKIEQPDVTVRPTAQKP